MISFLRFAFIHVQLMATFVATQPLLRTMNMGDADLKALNYFTCTLGESAEWKGQQPKGAKTAYHTVLQLVDNKAQETPDDPAIGFADFTAHQHDDGESSH